MQKDFPKLFFICSIICFIVASSFTVVNLFFPQYLNTTPVAGSPVRATDNSGFSVQLNPQNAMPESSPLIAWLQTDQNGSLSSLDQFQILGVSFVMGSPQLSRVIISSPGQPARTYAQGKSVSEGVVVDQITAQGVQLRGANNQTKVLLLPEKNKDMTSLLNSPMSLPSMPQAMPDISGSLTEPLSPNPSTSPESFPPEAWQRIQQ